MTIIDTRLAGLEKDGCATIPGVLSVDEVQLLFAALENAGGEGVRRGGDSSVFAIRNLLDVPAIAGLARSPAVRRLVESVLGPHAFAVRGILFDKTPGANWKVVWHQDLSIAVQERRDVPGFSPWSVKAGVAHVQPPISLLERMITVRLHLDDCGEENGPLRVLPGTHLLGRLDSADIQRERAAREERVCPVPTGGALMMRPLILHASSASTRAAHRRVVHLEFAAEQLPGGLEWQYRI